MENPPNEVDETERDDRDLPVENPVHEDEEASSGAHEDGPRRSAQAPLAVGGGERVEEREGDEEDADGTGVDELRGEVEREERRERLETREHGEAEERVVGRAGEERDAERRPRGAGRGVGLDRGERVDREASEPGGAPI